MAHSVVKTWLHVPSVCTLARGAVAEMIGVLLLVFVSFGAVASTSASGSQYDASRILAIAVAHSMVYGVMVAVAQPISGGHINPAVTFALLVAGRLSLITGAAYMFAQTLGAIVGGWIVKVVTAPWMMEIAATDLRTNVMYGQIITTTALLTSILLLTVFASMVHPHAPRHMAPILIALASLACHIVAVPLAGGAAMNPARAVGGAVWTGVWVNHWVYWVGPMLASLIVGVLYTVLVIVPEEQREREEEERMVAAKLGPQADRGAARDDDNDSNIASCGCV